MKTENRKKYRNIAIGIGTGLVLIFVASRFGHIVIGPRIILDSVPATSLTEPALTLSGTIKGGRLFWINNVQVPVDTQGRFETQLVVPSGYTIMVLEAEDELGTRRRKELPVYYLPSPTDSPTETSAETEPTDITNEPNL